MLTKSVTMGNERAASLWHIGLEDPDDDDLQTEQDR